MTTQEVKILWKHSQKWCTKWLLMLAFALFRGIRIGEICAINIRDFNEDFTQLYCIVGKSHVADWYPLIPELTAMVKEYISMNVHTFRDGYLFPYYSRKADPNRSHMTSQTAVTEFCKLRTDIGKEHPQFLEKVNDPGKVNRYRISWHSCRRWFETEIYEVTKDHQAVADIMRYLDVSTVSTYIDSYRTWRQEKEILKSTFSSHVKDIMGREKGQTNLVTFFCQR